MSRLVIVAVVLVITALFSIVGNNLSSVMPNSTMRGTAEEIPVRSLSEWSLEELEEEINKRKGGSPQTTTTTTTTAVNDDKPVETPSVVVKQHDWTATELEEEIAGIHGAQIRKWRSELTAALSRNDTDERLIVNLTQPAFPSNPLKKCKYVFIDFGANVGDTLRKFIDSYIPQFPGGKQRMLDVYNGRIPLDKQYGGRRMDNKWGLHRWIQQVMDSMKDKRVYPEDYCYYGIEGNPAFTQMLALQELSVNTMNPRPVRYAHFLTEHVGTSKDGMTTLFLDTVNKKDNFWGSSIMDSHQDVKKSGGAGAPVMGITLTTLLEKVVEPGGHAMIKIDIEGGEYPLLEEAVNSTIFCKLKEQGVRVDLLNEFHKDKVIGSSEPRLRYENVIKGDAAIRGCGVNYKVNAFLE